MKKIIQIVSCLLICMQLGAQHLETYKIYTRNITNSNLPNNTTDNITIDRKGVIWLTTDGGLVTYHSERYHNAEQTITKGKHLAYSAIETDNDNIKWIYAGKNIYSYNDKKWTKYDKKITGIDEVTKIVNNSKTGEVFFCSDEGLAIYKKGKWSKLKGLPSKNISFAKRDSKSRIWIGTGSETLVIDEKGRTQKVLDGHRITSMDEDEKGNLYFSLKKDEGIAIRYADGSVKYFTTGNSGIAANRTTKVLYDKKEGILWIATSRAGLIRFDLKDGWENYHPDNSDIPSLTISSMSFDKDGILYLATRAGMAIVKKMKL